MAAFLIFQQTPSLLAMQNVISDVQTCALQNGTIDQTFDQIRVNLFQHAMKAVDNYNSLLYLSTQLQKYVDQNQWIAQLQTELTQKLQEETLEIKDLICASDLIEQQIADPTWAQHLDLDNLETIVKSGIIPLAQNLRKILTIKELCFLADANPNRNILTTNEFVYTTNQNKWVGAITMVTPIIEQIVNQDMENIDRLSMLTDIAQANQLLESCGSEPQEELQEIMANIVYDLCHIELAIEQTASKECIKLLIGTLKNLIVDSLTEAERSTPDTLSLLETFEPKTWLIACEV